ncbi:unnamed protein product [Caenorhabditis bovis]|uniref:BHLH domain-containing protein n=1 Tax=Caenorhabditis bovis TaxID=2654633 RepID=A0A8S1EDW3_9PELO|nr:unnamed protein product [Caenorhabditis bovis]
MQDEPLDLSLPTTSTTTPSAVPQLPVEFEQQLQAALVEMYSNIINENILGILAQLVANGVSTEEKTDEMINVVEVAEEEEAAEAKKPPKRRMSSEEDVERKADRKRKSQFCPKRFEANARERNRVQQLSNMFNELRVTLPLPDEVKISKLSTLKVATAYIGFLGSILNDDEEQKTTYEAQLARELETAKLLRK